VGAGAGVLGALEPFGGVGAVLALGQAVYRAVLQLRANRAHADALQVRLQLLLGLLAQAGDVPGFDARHAALVEGVGRTLRRAGARPVSVAIHTAFGTQIVLGIATVMSGVAIWIAVLHQLTGALLVVATTWGAHALGRRG
jgi:high-affinity nickel permease